MNQIDKILPTKEEVDALFGDSEDPCRTCNHGTPFYCDAPSCNMFYDCGRGDGTENDYYEAIDGQKT